MSNKLKSVVWTLDHILIHESPFLNKRKGKWMLIQTLPYKGTKVEKTVEKKGI